MTFHLFGNILTGYGTAANNRGENDGNITTLQKILWKNEVHTTVSAEAIRWALRYYWQTSGNGCEVNRRWNDQSNDNEWQKPVFDPELYIDDDVLGFMRAEGAKVDASDEISSKEKGKKQAKGTTSARRGVLEVTRAISTQPYSGDITFNAKSGQKGSTSLYGTEVHATRYQYGFAMTPARLHQQDRVIEVLKGLISLGEVAGNHSRFLYDFAPDSIVLRWTHDFSPRLLYCFEESSDGELTMPDLVRRVQVGDVDPQELWIAGAAAETEDGEKLEELGAHVDVGIKSTMNAVIERMQPDLFQEAVA
jgi:CRISPR-associated protein Cst2